MKNRTPNSTSYLPGQLAIPGTGIDDVPLDPTRSLDREVPLPTPVAVARTGDRRTSHEAAALANANGDKLRASQARVLNMFRLYGHLADAELLEYLHEAETAAGLKPMSPSGVRSRRSELSKPNEQRLDELLVEVARARGFTLSRADELNLDVDDPSGDMRRWARETLLREGLRSPLWAVGTKKLAGRNVTVWGIAK